MSVDPVFRVVAAVSSLMVMPPHPELVERTSTNPSEVESPPARFRRQERVHQKRWVMEQTHGVSGWNVPTRSARRALAAGLALLFAFVPATAQSDEPAGPRILPAVADGPIENLATEKIAVENLFAAEETTSPPLTAQRLPPVEATISPVTTAGYSTVMTATDPYTGQQISYVEAPPGQSPVQPPSALNPHNNEPLFRFAGMQPPEVPPSEEEKAAEQKKAAQGGAAQTGPNGEQIYGQAPTNNSLQFLRDVDVLLAPGAWQFDTGFIYTHFANDFTISVRDPMGTVVGVQEADVRQRILYTPTAFRYGLTDNIQLFSALPIGFAGTQISTFGQSDSQDVGGIGDLTAGASIHLIDGEDQMPDIIGTVGFTAPTGDFNAPVFGVVPGSGLGQGFWAYNLQLLAIHRYDPVIVFYGGGYRHLFEREFNNVLTAPGEQINYMFGVGFAINDRVTVSGTFQGYYITDTYLNNQDVYGTNVEPMTMRFAATIVRNCRIVEPFVQFGLTDSAPRVNAGLVVTLY
jgi:hypothetical protein